MGITDSEELVVLDRAKIEGSSEETLARGIRSLVGIGAAIIIAILVAIGRAAYVLFR